MIGKGKIYREVWTTRGSRNSWTTRKITRACVNPSLFRYQSPLKEKQTPVEYLPIKVMFYKLTQIYLVGLLNNPREAERQSEKLLRRLIVRIGCYPLQKTWGLRWAQVSFYSLTTVLVLGFLVLFEPWTFSFMDPFSFSFKLLRWQTAKSARIDLSTGTSFSKFWPILTELRVR